MLMRFWWSTFLLLLFLASGAAFYHWFSSGRWPQLPKRHPRATSALVPGTISASGGRYFAEKVLIPLKVVSQHASEWENAKLAWGENKETIGSHGCALCCAVMIMQSYNLSTDPKSLNLLLVRNKGYTAEGWLIWPRVTDLAPGHVRFVYEGPPSHPEIDRNLQLGNPVIVKLSFPKHADGSGGGSHFVVICGKEGLDYLVADPGRGGERGIYPLKDFGSPIEGLRYYEPIIPPRAIPVTQGG